MRVSDRTRPRALQFLCSLLNSDISDLFRKTTFFVSSPDAPESSVITRETEFLGRRQRGQNGFERVRAIVGHSASSRLGPQQGSAKLACLSVRSDQRSPLI